MSIQEQFDTQKEVIEKNICAYNSRFWSRCSFSMEHSHTRNISDNLWRSERGMGDDLLCSCSHNNAVVVTIMIGRAAQKAGAKKPEGS